MRCDHTIDRINIDQCTVSGIWGTYQQYNCVQDGTLDVALEALLRGAESHIDPGTRKTCVQVLAFTSSPKPACAQSALQSNSLAQATASI